MKTHELRMLGTTELSQRVISLQTEYVTMRETIRNGKEKNNSALKRLRSDIARVKTILAEQQHSKEEPVDTAKEVTPSKA